jgi:23S rRNA pseudouridine1911/1915/1917 synthase
MTGYYEPLVYTVPPEDNGIILKTILQNRMNVSRKLLSRLKRTERGITVNGERVYISIRVKTGDRIELRMQEEESEDIMPQPIPLAILHEDDHLLILDKPAGIVVHPTHGHYLNTLANGVVYHWKQLGQQIRFRPVHRLDQETSGVIAIAKNPYVHQHISAQMMEGTVDKEYLALVHGRLRQSAGTIDGPIDRDPESPHVRIVTESGYPAVTRYEAAAFYKGATLVRIRLETGRTHQIRVHMKHLGHPLVGDKMYGPEEPAGLAAGMQRHALHAVSLGFRHPGTNRKVSFTAPLPADMSAAIALLETER